MFSNEYFELQEVDNSAFIDDLVDWVFGGRGELKIKEIKYYKTGGQKTNETTIGDLFVFLFFLSFFLSSFFSDSFLLFCIVYLFIFFHPFLPLICFPFTNLP